MKMQLFLFCLLCYYFFFLLFSLYLFVLYCLHVLDVRSADVTARVASSKICAGSCAAALRIRRLSWTAQPFLCILHEEKYRGVAVCPSRTQLLSRRAGVMTLAAHTEAEPELITDWDPPAPNFLPIQRLRRQTGCLSAALCLRVCVCQPWREICTETAAPSRLCMWKLKRSMRIHLRWLWAAESRLRPAEIPHAEEEEEEWIRLQRSWLTTQLLLYCCVSAHISWF